jgi:hypothetical protein
MLRLYAAAAGLQNRQRGFVGVFETVLDSAIQWPDRQRDRGSGTRERWWSDHY